jgi:hypothetical protein
VDDQNRRPDGDYEETPTIRKVASEIYGLVVCSATLAAAAASGQESFVEVSVLVTVVVYWMAESYSRALARHSLKDAPLGWSDIRAILSQGWPMVSASFLPLLTLVVLGALRAPISVAVNVSLAVATVLLVGAGWSASRASGLRGWRLLTSTAASAVFGLTMVGLKNLLHV